MTEPRKVLIVPCSGIGKPYGTVSRVAAYQITEDDRPESTQLIPLALLVLGDEESRAALAEYPAITLDGCKLACATKMVQECGGQVAKDFSVLDVFRRYRDFKPQGIAELNEGGEKLAVALAKEVDVAVDLLIAVDLLTAVDQLTAVDLLTAVDDQTGTDPMRGERGQNA